MRGKRILSIALSAVMSFGLIAGVGAPAASAAGTQLHGAELYDVATKDKITLSGLPFKVLNTPLAFASLDGTKTFVGGKVDASVNYTYVYTDHTAGVTKSLVTNAFLLGMSEDGTRALMTASAGTNIKDYFFVDLTASTLTLTKVISGAPATQGVLSPDGNQITYMKNWGSGSIDAVNVYDNTAKKTTTTSMIAGYQVSNWPVFGYDGSVYSMSVNGLLFRTKSGVATKLLDATGNGTYATATTSKYFTLKTEPSAVFVTGVIEKSTGNTVTVKIDDAGTITPAFTDYAGTTWSFDPTGTYAYGAGYVYKVATKDRVWIGQDTRSGLYSVSSSGHTAVGVEFGVVDAMNSAYTFNKYDLDTLFSSSGEPVSDLKYVTSPAYTHKADMQVMFEKDPSAVGYRIKDGSNVLAEYTFESKKNMVTAVWASAGGDRIVNGAEKAVYATLTGLSYDTTYNLTLDVVGRHTVHSQPLVVTTPASKFVVGNKNAVKGAVVMMDGKKMRVLGDNTLVSENSMTYTGGYTGSSYPYAKLTLNDTSNIGYKLDQWAKTSFSGVNLDAIATFPYSITSQDTGLEQYVFTSKATLPTSSQLLNLGFLPPTSWSFVGVSDTAVPTVGAANEKIMGYSVMDTRVTVLREFSPVDGAPVVFPVITLKWGTELTGSGTGIDPYTISKAGTSDTSPVVTPPTAPLNLQAVSSEEGTVEVKWSAVDGATGYTVYRDAVKLADVTALSYKDATAKAGVSYNYTVRASNTGGVSPASDALKIDVVAPLAVPSDFVLVSDKKGAVEFTWKEQSGVSYKVYRNGVLFDTVPSAKYVDTTGKVGDVVSYTVKAARNGVETATSAPFDVTLVSSITLSVPVVKVDSDIVGKVAVSWSDVPDASAFEVVVNTDAATTVRLLGYSNRTAKVGDVLSIKVRATDQDGTFSDWSTPVMVTVKDVTPTPVDPKPVDPKPVVAKPTGFTLVGKTSTSAAFKWTKVDGFSYILSNQEGQAYEGLEGSYNHVGLEPSTSYTYNLVAVKDGVESEPVTVTVLTRDMYVPYPMGLTVTDVTYAKASLAWNAVVGADSYTISRNGVEIDTVTDLSYTDMGVFPGASHTYGVKANMGAYSSKEAKKTVYVPTESVTSPDSPTGIKVVRIHHDSVTLEWPYVASATKYKVFRDSALVYEGPLTVVTDTAVAPSTNYEYRVVAVNTAGETSSEKILVMTADLPQPIPVYQAEPQTGTITFEFATVVGAVQYGVARNPRVTYVANGDGSYTKMYTNEQTGEVENQGVVWPTADGRLPFSEDGVQPGQDYTYKITAYVLDSNGNPVEAGTNEQTITTPTDGTGATVGANTPTTPTNPGTGGTTPTTPTDPGTGGTTPTTPTNPGTGGTTPTTPTNPGTGGTTPTTPADPGTGSTTPTTPTNPGTGGTTPTMPINPGTGGTTPTTPTNPGSGDTMPTTPGTLPQSPSFTDVSPSSYAYQAVEALYAAGVVKGTTAGVYDVGGKVTRAQFAIMLKRALGYTSSEGYKSAFRDFDQSAWYSEELAEALNTGVTKGYTDGTYRPNAYIPREQASVMIGNILRMNDINPSDVAFNFSDAYKTVAWAYGDLKANNAAGIITGYPDATIRPKEEMTRGEAAVIVYRLLGVLGNN